MLQKAVLLLKTSTNNGWTSPTLRRGHEDLEHDWDSLDDHRPVTLHPQEIAAFFQDIGAGHDASMENFLTSSLQSAMKFDNIPIRKYLVDRGILDILISDITEEKKEFYQMSLDVLSELIKFHREFMIIFDKRLKDRAVFNAFSKVLTNGLVDANMSGKENLKTFVEDLPL
eukprot:gene4249-4957_t